jgi:dihydrodipicolinate synthase/N-acetylneuraminate lyase
VFKQIAAVFFDAMRGGAGLCQLGVIGLSVAQIRTRIETGLELGFRDFQISLPSWGAVTDQELARFFRDVLGPYPQARFLHYNLGRTGRVLTGADYTRLAAEHPNLVATKSGGHTVAALLEGSPELCRFFTELDYAAACLLGGACGLLVSVSAVHLGRSREFFEAGQRGDGDALRRLIRELSRIRAQVIAVVAQERGHMDGAYDKLYARLADPEFPLGLLSPYQGASPAAFEAFRSWLVQEAPDWASAREVEDEA